MYTNGKKLFSISKGNSEEMRCLYGIRALSMIGIVLMHTYSITLASPIYNQEALLKVGKYQAMRNLKFD